jgi:hypothetical protein
MRALRARVQALRGYVSANERRNGESGLSWSPESRQRLAVTFDSIEETLIIEAKS